MIRGIIFDCFGVLYHGSLGTFVSLAPADRRQEVVDINTRKDYGFMSYDEYLQQTADAVGVTRTEIEQIIKQKHVRNQELVEYVSSLKNQAVYKIGMLSNIGEKMMDDMFSHSEQSQLFDAVVLSYQVGMVKPDQEIFELMAAELGLDPSECIMIDDLITNCRGAELAGMKSIQHINNDDTKQKLASLLA